MSKPEMRLRSAMIEVGVLSLLLGLCKPIYVVVALVYVLTVFGPHGRRERWPIGIPVLAAAAVSAAWQRFAQQYFLCDQRFFGVVTDPTGQVRHLVRQPFSLPLIMVRSVYHYGIHWTRDFVQVGNRVVVVADRDRCPLPAGARRSSRSSTARSRSSYSPSASA